MDFLLSIIVTGFGLFVGLVFFSLGAVLLSQQDTETEVKRLESDYAFRKYGRTIRKVNLLYEIGKPNMSDGTYSPDKMILWDTYFQMEKEDDCLTSQEREHLLSI
jgi:hypothetical protein